MQDWMCGGLEGRRLLKQAAQLGAILYRQVLDGVSRKIHICGSSCGGLLECGEMLLDGGDVSAEERAAECGLRVPGQVVGDSALENLADHFLRVFNPSFAADLVGQLQMRDQKRRSKRAERVIEDFVLAGD